MEKIKTDWKWLNTQQKSLSFILQSIEKQLVVRESTA